jgi:hypothetical protein
MVNEDGLVITNPRDPSPSRHKVTLILKRIAEHKVKDICAGYIGGLSCISRLRRLGGHDVGGVPVAVCVSSCALLS